jgi:hypothetical protein
MLPEYISKTFPSNDAADGQYLYRSLGSFWTQVFQDREALRGYTTGMAEEFIQAYYRLIETLKQYSVKEISPLRKERWKPLMIKKSEFNKSAFVFESGGAVFGFQPNEDKFYANQLFRFGFPKESVGNKVYSYSPTFKLGTFGAIANRIISPSLLLLPGVNVLLHNNTLFFNTDLFSNDYIPRARLISDSGVPATYQDADGNKIDDELIVLWMYHAEVDYNDLHDNFGVLLDIKPTAAKDYKRLLQAVMSLSVEGPTITAINSCLAAFVNTPIIIEPSEIIEDIFDQLGEKIIITDKHTYKVPVDQELNAKLQIGDRVHAGEILSNNIKIIDIVIDPVWWKNEISTNKLAFSSHVFAANTKHQLFFENTVSLVTYTERKLTFPVLGEPEDVAAFQAHINDDTPKPDGSPGNLTQLLDALNFKRNATNYLSINPVDFLFNNILKNNTLLVKLDFYSEAQLLDFFDLFPTIKDYLPAHVYFLLYIKLQLPADEIYNLNSALTIPGFNSQRFSSDGSNRFNGNRPYLGDDDPLYYKDYENRLFCVAVGPYRNPIEPHYPPTSDDTPLHYDENLDHLAIDNSQTSGEVAGIKCGLLRTEIPTSVQPPGELTARIPSTREIQSILLIDF